MGKRTRHNIGRSDAGRAGRMLPGYAAVRISAKPKRSMGASLLLIGTGIVSALMLVMGIFRIGF